MPAESARRARIGPRHARRRQWEISRRTVGAAAGASPGTRSHRRLHVGLHVAPFTSSIAAGEESLSQNAAPWLARVSNSHRCKSSGPRKRITSNSASGHVRIRGDQQAEAARQRHGDRVESHVAVDHLRKLRSVTCSRTCAISAIGAPDLVAADGGLPEIKAAIVTVGTMRRAACWAKNTGGSVVVRDSSPAASRSVHARGTGSSRGPTPDWQLSPLPPTRLAFRCSAQAHGRLRSSMSSLGRR